MTWIRIGSGKRNWPNSDALISFIGARAETPRVPRCRMPPLQNLPWGDWPLLLGVIQLPIQVLPDRIEVAVPSAVYHLNQPSLGLFVRAGLEAFSDDVIRGQSSLSCTAAAAAWHCLNGTGLVLLPQPEWRGSYIVLALTEDCTPLAASEVFSAGPLPTAGSPLIEMIDESPPVLSPMSACHEMRAFHCSKLTIRVTGRREAHASDAIALYPVTAAAFALDVKPARFEPRGNVVSMVSTVSMVRALTKVYQVWGRPTP